MAGTNQAECNVAAGAGVGGEALAISEDMAESLLTAWGESEAAQIARHGYSAVAIWGKGGSSLTPEERAHLEVYGTLPPKTPEYYWLPDDLDRVDVALQWLRVEDGRSVKIIKGVYVYGWSKGRAHGRAVGRFRVIYGKVCDVRDGMHNAQ
jgi:hypothetical protein